MFSRANIMRGMGNPSQVVETKKRQKLTPPEKLRRFMKREKLKAADLARRTGWPDAGISPAMFSAFIRGHRRAGLQTSVIICRLTKGYIQPPEWLDFEPSARSKPTLPPLRATA